METCGSEPQKRWNHHHNGNGLSCQSLWQFPLPKAILTVAASSIGAIPPKQYCWLLARLGRWLYGQLLLPWLSMDSAKTNAKTKKIIFSNCKLKFENYFFDFCFVYFIFYLMWICILKCPESHAMVIQNSDAMIDGRQKQEGGRMLSSNFILHN